MIIRQEKMKGYEIIYNLVGYILFTKVAIDGNVQLAFAPLSVMPKYQRQGIKRAIAK